MSLRRFFSAAVLNNAKSKRSGYAEIDFASSDERFGKGKSKARTGVDVRSVVQRRFMSMMAAHDRMRARVLRSSPTSTYPVSGD